MIDHLLRDLQVLQKADFLIGKIDVISAVDETVSPVMSFAA